MTPQDFDRVRELFSAVRELPPRQRTKVLEAECAQRPDLRAEVESLLAHKDDPHQLLAVPSRHQGLRGQLERALQSIEPPELPKRIGRYAILDVLGEGGMGVVYLAEQDQPRRTVALKVIKPGIESRQVLQRFEHEGQVLGWLQHPGIAQIYEAGAAETGRGLQPFFAMELVRGQRLTQHTQELRLDIRGRLELLAKICDAVHHAHQKGVIHRDLKPGNILVDDSGQPKILDFGVARATDADIRTTTLQTDVGQLVGTIAYMSPEQIAGDSRELDTRSDVYSLGVILFELLTGSLPLDVVGKTIPQAARIIAEQEPLSISSLNRALRGDLATITAKALEKDKTRRYQSASDLAADIRRYLSNQPIAARPATTLYQLGKFARRNRALVAAVGIAFVALSTALVNATVERNRAMRAEQLAEQRREQAEAQRAHAQAEASKSHAINDFMQKVFASVDPSQTLGRELPFRSVLDQAAERIETDLPGQPEVQAAVRDTLGQTYRSLGLLDESETHLRQALEARRQLLGEEHPATLASQSELALTLQGQGKLPEAEPLYQDALEAYRRLLGAENPNTITALNNLGWLYQSQGKLAEAEDLFRESLELRLRVSGEDDMETLRTKVNLARILQERGKLNEAEQESRQAVEACRRVLGDRHPMTLESLRSRVWLLRQLKRLDEAEELARQSLELTRRVLGPEHPLTFHSMNNLAAVLCDAGRPAEAEDLHRQTWEARRRVLGEEHPNTLDSLNNVAVALHTQQKPAEAEPLYADVLAARQRLLGEEHPDTLSAMNNLALVLRAQGKMDQAEQLLTSVLEVRRRLLGEAHPATLNSMKSLSFLYTRQERFEQAEPLFAEMLEIKRRELGEDHPGTLGTMSTLGWVFQQQGRYPEAEALYVEVLEIQRRVLGEEHPQTLIVMGNLGMVYSRQGRYDLAEPLLVESLAGHIRVLGENHQYTLTIRRNLAMLYKDQQRYQQAEPLAVECYEHAQEVNGPAHTETRQAVELLVDLYDAWGRPDQAERWRAKLNEMQPASEPGA